MAWIDITSGTSSPEGFNWNTEQDKLKRKRAAALTLRDLALKDQQGQFIRNGDFIGFTGGNTLASAAAQIASAYFSKNAEKEGDAMASDIDKMSNEAFLTETNKLDALFKPKANPTGSMQGLDTAGSQPTSAQAFPVRDRPVDVRPLDEAPPSPVVPFAKAPSLSPEQQNAMAAKLNVEQQGALPTPKIAAQTINPGASSAAAEPPARSGLMPDLAPRATPPAPTPAAQQPSQGEVLAQLHAISKTGPMGQQFASQQLQQLYGPKANGYEFKDVNGKLVAVNPRNPKDTMVVFDGGAKPEVAAAAKKDRREEVKLWGEQRRTVGEAKERLDAAGNAITRLQDGIALAQDVGIRGIFSSGWENAKAAIKENPKLRNLEMLDSELLLDAATALKGAMSDKDLEFIRQGAPNKNSTVEERLQWAERILPRLQSAQQRAQKLHAGERATAKELGIPEFMDAEEDAPSQPQQGQQWYSQPYKRGTTLRP